MKQKWIWIVLVLLLAAAFAGYWMYSRTNPDVVQAKPDFIVTATDLIEAFETDSNGAAKQYANKVVQVSGKATSIDASGAVVLGLDDMPSVVVVGLEQRYMADVQQIKPGQQVTLQGLYSGYESSSNNPGDLLAGLGITIQFRSGGLKKKG
jgi:hypothetical protein